MSVRKVFCALSVGFSVQGAVAQQTDAVDATATVNCEDPATLSTEACLGLPDPMQPITNFVPVGAPVIGAALAGFGGGSSSSTPSTPSTN